MTLFACPNCMARLTYSPGALRCASGHSFDIAKEGYVNLLPVHQRKSRAPGDTPEMVTARRRFLANNHFEPLAGSLRSACLGRGRVERLLDIGCGEGYFASQFIADVAEVYGIDVSKPAVRAAARRTSGLQLAVGSSNRLPLLDAAFDTAIVILAPFGSDTQRVVKIAGIIARVTPGPDHLGQLKQLVYRDPRPHQRATLDLPQLCHVHQQRIEFDMRLDQEARADLIAMTPMQYRIEHTLRQRALQDGTLNIKADFWIDLFERVDGPQQVLAD